MGATTLENDHTGKYIDEKLTQMITEWKLREKLFLILRDNAANLVRTAHDQYASLGCASHTLQLVIKDALFSEEAVKNVIKDCRKIVGHFRHSEQASKKLRKCQEQCDLPCHSLIQDIETRWNSTYLMLERLLEQKKAVNLYSVEHGGISTLSSSDWDLLKDITSALKFFYEATLDLSYDNACISIIIPIISLLNRKLQIEDDAIPNEKEELINMKKNLQVSLNKRFAFIKDHPLLITASLLDPRFKNKYLTSYEVEIGVKEIVNFLTESHTQINKE